VSRRARERRWRREALAACDVVIDDWRARPTGEHEPHLCEFCRRFTGCVACPVIGWLGYACEEHPTHAAWAEARQRLDEPEMDRLAAQLVQEIGEMRAAIEAGRFDRRGLRKALRERIKTHG